VAALATFPVLIGVAIVMLAVLLSLMSLRRVRWYRKPLLGHWKEWPD
jgi:hypothetical protein